MDDICADGNGTELHLDEQVYQGREKWRREACRSTSRSNRAADFMDQGASPSPYWPPPKYAPQNACREASALAGLNAATQTMATIAASTSEAERKGWMPITPSIWELPLATPTHLSRTQYKSRPPLWSRCSLGGSCEVQSPPRVGMKELE
jgi:hypothetical protein